jgi:hypothetical protein
MRGRKSSTPCAIEMKLTKQHLTRRLAVAELSEKQLECPHHWGLVHEDFITGGRSQDCYDCGARRQLPSSKGSPAWKAQMMLKYEKLESCTLGEAEVWFDRNKVKMRVLEGYRD